MKVRMFLLLREAHGKARPTSRLALHFQQAPVHTSNLRGNRQPKSSATTTAGASGLHAIKALKERGKMLWWDAWPLVSDGDADLPGNRFCLHDHLTGRGRELNGIIEQIEQEANKVIEIALHTEVGGNPPRERNLSRLCQRLDLFDDGTQHLAHFQRFRFPPQAPLIEPGKQEQVIGQADETVGFVIQGVQGCLVLGARAATAECDVNPAFDGRERGTQLMSRVSRETAFALKGSL